jgi:predicted Zn-dependent protease
MKLKDIFREETSISNISIDSKGCIEETFHTFSGVSYTTAFHSESKSLITDTLFKQDFNSNDLKTLYKTINCIKDILQCYLKYTSIIQYVFINEKLIDQRIDKFLFLYTSFEKDQLMSIWDFYNLKNINTLKDKIESIHSSVKNNVKKRMLPTKQIEFDKNIVLSSGNSGVLFHELGHLLEYDNLNILKKGTRFKSNLNLINDPTLEAFLGSYKFDDEGTKAKKILLIKDGIVQKYLNTKKHNDESKLNGNARKERYFNTNLPRMSITYVGKGNEDFNSIISGIKSGYYVKNISNVYTNIHKGMIRATIDGAFKISNGKIDDSTNYVGAFPFSRVNDFLNHIKRIGNDLCIVPGKGLCGKKGQKILTSYGCPTIEIRVGEA